MPKWILRCSLVALLVLYFGHSMAVLEPRAARAEDLAAVTEASADEGTGRHLFPPRRASSSRGGEPSGYTGGWWLGTVGIALALAVVGGLSVVSRRFAPAAQPGALGLRVVGKTSLSPRHSVYLVRAGDRVLVLGTGPQGPPSLLGELDDEPGQAIVPPVPRPVFDRGGAA
ncbi:MAG: flagellar biosynthetic protein FliO [Isosphaeraceae bacterium]|nr:flagellar biosynthetic protein FliO [Isosphaeraceae bacterium]